MAVLIKASDFVGPGEKKAAAYLEKHLPADWVVICNKELVRPGSVREVDFIVVGQHAIFSIEEKYWWGVIHGNENGWILSSGESYRNPLSQAGDASRRLAGFLRDNVPALNSQPIGRLVAPRVLMTHDDVTLLLNDPRAHEQVLRLKGSDEDLVRFDDQQASVLSIGPTRDAIVHALGSLPNRPEIPATIGSYSIIESLPSPGIVRSFRGRHEDGSERVLKIVPTPFTLDSDRLGNAKNVLLREYETLKKLQSTGHVPQVDPYFKWDQDQFWVLPIHPIAGRTLRADSSDALPQEDRIWKVINDAFGALESVQGKGVVHRGLNPDRVYLSEVGSIVFVDLLVARLDDRETIAEEGSDLDPDGQYRAPECRISLASATTATDVYAMTAALYFWITGIQIESDGPLPPIETLRPDLSGNLTLVLSTLFDTCLRAEPGQRPSVAQVLELIAVHRAGAPPASIRPEPSEGLEEGRLVENQYRILRRLGEGATAVTYLSEDIWAGSLFVLKTIKNPELIARLAKAEFQSLMYLHHRNLPQIFDIRPPQCPFHLKLEYVQGSALREVAQLHRRNLRSCLNVGTQVLAALSYLGEHNLIHRDVSPGNILIPDEEAGAIKLIDFGLATGTSGTSSAVGTPRYRAPEIDTGGEWTGTCDLYSLAIILFELLTGRLPYEMRDGVADKRALIRPDREDEAMFGKALLDVFLRAASPDPRERYQTASEFASALRASSEKEPETLVSGEEMINPTVDALRGLYRNSRLGNPDNRGLDTDFALATYVKTRLDTDLLPELLSGAFRLLILSGNPGDGKTAFVQQVRTELIGKGATADRDDTSGWQLELGGRRFAAIYDASESHGGRSADDQLDDALKPLEGSEPGDPLYTLVVAANDGRIVDFFDRYGALRYAWIWDSLRPQIYEQRPGDPSIVVVDLKARCLVNDDAATESISSRLLDTFVASDRWTPCERCVARYDCPIRANALSFSERDLGSRVREQLHKLLLAVHLQRERRPTLRDLRSALAFLITHDLGCKDIHFERKMGSWPLGKVTRLYFNAAFDGSGSPDLLLDQWKELDPADVPSPRIDRFLYFHRAPDQAGTIRSTILPANIRTNLPITMEHLTGIEWMRGIKRRYFFESTYRPDANGGDEPPSGDQLFAYRHFRKFVNALSPVGDGTELLTLLLDGISRADGVSANTSNGSLALRAIESSDDSLQVIKRFSRNDFHLRPRKQAARFTESIVDHLTLEYRTGVPALEIDLDLFEFLARASDGFLPGSEEQRPLLEDLATFKNQLLSKPTSEVTIIERGLRAHDIRMEDGAIRRVRVNA